MSKRDFEWLADLLAALFVRQLITADGVNEIVERLETKYPLFDGKRFALAYARGITHYATR